MLRFSSVIFILSFAKHFKKETHFIHADQVENIVTIIVLTDKWVQ